MTDISANLTLPFLLPAQAQKHVTHNEALSILDHTVQMVLQADDAVVPPVAPLEGQTWALGVGTTGDWSGQDGKIACYCDGGWLFVAPSEGWTAWHVQQGCLVVCDGSGWAPADRAMQNLDGVGIGTSWDSYNRLAVAAEASLFTHAGGGHRLSVNKSSVSETASLVFQTNWSGRAELGLAGGDDLTFKVSPDGLTWKTALAANAGTGAVTVPMVTSGSVLVADGEVGVIAAPTAGGMVMIIASDSGVAVPTHAGSFAYSSGGMPGLTGLGVGPDMAALGATVLSGTTGAVGQTSVAAIAGGIAVENRSGHAQRYAYTFLCGNG